MEKGSLSAVYFQRLKTDATKVKKRPELLETYNIAISNYVELSSVAHGFGGADAILSMAAAEASKEQEMLRQIFGVDLHIDLDQPGAIKQLTETINDVFQFRSVYERNKALLLSADFDAQKGIYSYFPGYFKKALDKAKPGILNQIVNLMEANHSLGAGDAAEQVFTSFLPSLIQGALREMFTQANVESSSMDSKYKDAYQQIFHFITKFRSQNLFTEGLARAWDMDAAIEKFSEVFSDKNKIPKAGTLERAVSAAMNQIQSNFHSKGGDSLEVLIDQCLAIVANGLNTVPNVSVAGVYTGAGAVKARADNVFYFNVDSSPIEKAFKQVKDSNSDRKTAVQAFTELGNQLDKVKDGFIVYVSDKNYTLNDSFYRRGGMSAGTSWSLNQIYDILGGVVNNIDQIVYNILQNGEGAIRSGDTENAEKVMAEGIAYYLFDDYTTIGNTGGNAIHVMGLQGMLVPLSAFLYAFGEAVKAVEASPTAYVKVSIKAPAVNDSDDEAYWMENWNAQYESSMKKTKMSVHFMKNFIGFVRQYL